MTWEDISKNLFEKRTAKRFTLHPFGLNFIIRDNGKELSAKQIVDLLNENEQLKQKNDNLVNMVARVQYRADSIKEDNEQSKQQIKLLKLALCEELQDNGNAFFIRIFDDLFGLNYDEWESKHEYPDWEEILKNKKEYGE